MNSHTCHPQQNQVNYLFNKGNCIKHHYLSKSIPYIYKIKQKILIYNLYNLGIEFYVQLMFGYFILNKLQLKSRRLPVVTANYQSNSVTATHCFIFSLSIHLFF